MTNFEPCAAEVMRRFARASDGEMIEVGGGVAGFVESDSPVNAVKGMDGAVGRAELNRIVEFYSDHKKDAVVELAPWVEAACLGDLVALGFERVAAEDLMARRSEDLGEKFDAVMDVEACCVCRSLERSTRLAWRLGGWPLGVKEWLAWGTGRMANW
jgi:hypothetical protein